MGERNVTPNQITRKTQKESTFQNESFSQTARFCRKKDGSESFVIVTIEIAIKPGVVEFTQFFTVGDPAIKIEGEKVIHYPRFPELQLITLKAEGFRADKGKLVITRGSLVDGEKAA